MATKNNPKNKGLSGGKKFIDGKEIEPVKYIGTYFGYGKYISAKYAKTTDIILDADGKPVKWSDIPLLAN
jgi:hypothetical protein